MEVLKQVHIQGRYRSWDFGAREMSNPQNCGMKGGLYNGGLRSIHALMAVYHSIISWTAVVSLVPMIFAVPNNAIKCLPYGTEERPIDTRHLTVTNI